MSDGMASNGLKFTKFLENWSGGSRVGVRDSTRTGMHTRARTHTHTHAHTHTHTHHITSHHVDPIHLFTVRKGQ